MDVVLHGCLDQPERVLIRAARSWKRNHRDDMLVRYATAPGKPMGDVIGRVRLIGDRGLEMRIVDLRSSEQLQAVLDKIREAGLRID
jgi:hypothetical protein